MGSNGLFSGLIMETIKVKRKEFEIVDTLKEGKYKATRKGKTFYVSDFKDNKDAFEKYFDAAFRLKNTGVKHPKLVLVDKKTHIIVEEFIEGVSALKLLMEPEVDEYIYQQIFTLMYLARLERLNVNPDPECYLVNDKTLYYVSKEFKPYKDENAFVKNGIRLWFKTKEFKDLLTEKQIPNNVKIETDYIVNRQIVLMTCKYYM